MKKKIKKIWSYIMIKDSHSERKHKLIAKLKILTVVQELIKQHNYEAETLYYLLQFWEEITKIVL
tara:strand:+ start:647 stop:841 length:195 start_codon:yes stop_codon:yes gene_type:complete